MGKAQIKVFCQQFSYNATFTLKRNVKNLENEINEMERRLIDVDDHGSMDVLKKKKMELKSLLEERVKGALVRARISSIKEMDAPTTYFFGLERKEAQKKCMLHLRRKKMEQLLQTQMR